MFLFTNNRYKISLHYLKTKKIQRVVLKVKRLDLGVSPIKRALSWQILFWLSKIGFLQRFISTSPKKLGEFSRSELQVADHWSLINSRKIYRRYHLRGLGYNVTKTPWMFPPQDSSLLCRRTIFTLQMDVLTAILIRNQVCQTKQPNVQWKTSSSLTLIIHYFYKNVFF